MLILIILGIGLGSDLKAQTDCDESCIDWWLVYVDDYGRVLSEQYLYTTCNGKQSISSCPEATGRAEIRLTPGEASCEEEFLLSVVFSHEQNAYCGASVKARGRITATGGGRFSARAKLDKTIGSHIIVGICETAFYSIEDRSYISRINKPYVTAAFIADVGVGIKVRISDGRFVTGDGWLWYEVERLREFRTAEFKNPLCW